MGLFAEAEPSMQWIMRDEVGKSYPATLLLGLSPFIGPRQGRPGSSTDDPLGGRLQRMGSRPPASARSEHTGFSGMSPYLASWIVLYVVVVATPFLPFMQNNVYIGPFYFLLLSAAAWLLLYAQSKKDVDEYMAPGRGASPSTEPESPR
jgi:hypothetical protein